jgi:tetratricopeptide (TPR) repeat protein
MSLAELATIETLQRCTKASELIYAGRYEEAKNILGNLWRGIGERPMVNNYPPEVAAEILLQCGCLYGFLGNAQAKDVHEKAKDLLTEALRLFQACGNQAKASEAHYELGICYFRVGAYDEARIVLDQALDGATPEHHGKIVIGKTIVESFSGHCEKAYEILMEAKPFFETASDALRGRWHGHMGLVHRGLARGRIEYLDRAIIEYTAAIYHYELAGHLRYCGSNLNNLAFLLYKLGRYDEAHDHLDKAHLIFSRLSDKGNIAQVEETRVRAFIAEGRYRDAWRVIIGVVDVLERGGESALLVDALTNKAIVQARLADHARSLQTFKHAIRIGEEAGALFNAGQAALSLMEEHKLSHKGVYKAYRIADQYLSKTQDEEVMERLRKCARLAVSQLGGPELGDNFSLPSVLHELEARYIEEALARGGGKITKAARILGISHQALIGIVSNRHKQLTDKRKPVQRRRKSIIKNGSN